MDYVFTRGENRQWYLTALQESEMQVEVRPPAPTDALVEELQNEELGTADAPNAAERRLRPSLQSRNSPQSRRSPRQQTNSLPRADKNRACPFWHGGCCFLMCGRALPQKQWCNPAANML